MSTASNRAKRRRRRGVTRRVRDSKGNIVVKKYAKRTSGIPTPPFLKFKRIPTTLLGIAMVFYAVAAANYKSARNNNIDPWFDLQFLADIYDNPETQFFFMGLITIGLAAMLGWGLFTTGFVMRKWGGSWKQLFAVWMAAIVLLSVLSPFINEPGLIRQQDDDDFIVNTDDYDLSGLDSPFYSELLNGLLDLLGNIPDIDERVALITQPNGAIFDKEADRYLYRWRVAETYDTDIYDFEEGFPNYQTDYLQFNPLTNTMESIANPGLTIAVNGSRNMQQLRIAEQYLTLTSSYQGQALTPWNSQYGALIGDPNDVTATLINEGSFVSINEASTVRDINEQPILGASFSQSRTQGFIEYDSWWIEEDKEAIADQSWMMDELATAWGNSGVGENLARFGDLASISSNDPSFGIDEIWGTNSLPIPAGVSTYQDGDTAFKAAYDALNKDDRSTITVYSQALKIAQQVQSAIIDGILGNTLSIDPAAAQSVADETTDKAYWFYQAIAEGSQQSFGMKELLAGFTNMLRSFGIPARPVVGFSVGDFSRGTGTFDETNKEILTNCNDDCDTIELRFEHLHVWIEALIPWGSPTNPNFSWGIFNPIPDPLILADSGLTDFEYGRNALGGSPEIELVLDSGEVTNLGTTIDFATASVDTFKFMQMGTDINGAARVLFEGEPANDQQIDLRFVTIAEIANAGNLQIEDIDTIGIQLAPITTTGPDGWANFSLFVDRDGFVYQFNATNPTLNVSTPINPNAPLNVLDPLGLASGDVNNMDIYGLVSRKSLSFDIELMAFRFNATLDLEILDAPLQTVISPFSGDSFNAYGVQVGSTITVELRVTDDGEPVIDLPGVDLLILTEQKALELFNAIAVLDTNQVNSLVVAATVGGFGITNSSGYANVTVDLSIVAGIIPENVYVLVANFGNSTFTNPPVNMWYSNDMALVASLETGIWMDNPLPVLNSVNSSQFWDVTVQATAFGINPIFNSEPGVDVSLEYYIVRDDSFTANPTFTDMSNFLQNCDTEVTCIQIPYVNGVGLNYTGTNSTDEFGFASITIRLDQNTFSAGLWQIIIIAEDYSTFTTANLAGFWVTSPPVPPLLILNNLLSDPYLSPENIEPSQNPELQMLNILFRIKIFIAALFVFKRRITS